MIIKKEVLDNILGLSKQAYPYEVGGLLLGRKAVNDYLIIPGNFSSSSIYVHLDRIPIYPNLEGTFHSHPTPNNRPSRADLRFFSRIGHHHLIIANPYTPESTACYDSRGRKSELVVK